MNMADHMRAICSLDRPSMNMLGTTAIPSPTIHLKKAPTLCI